MKRKDKRSRNGQLHNVDSRKGATSKLGARCPDLEALRSIVVQANRQAPAPAPVPPAPPKAGPKPKLTTAAQSRLDDGFEAQMLAKRAAAEASEAAERDRVSRSKSRFTSALKGEDAEVEPTPQPVSTPRVERDVVAEIRQALSDATLQIEDRPAKISDEARDGIEVAILHGSKAIMLHDGPDELGFIVGFDLGTSSLKVALRQPHQARDPIFAMDVPDELQSHGDPFLWQTVVWFHPESERFTLFPVSGAIPLAGFKTGVIGGKGTARVVPECDVSRSEATVAFMALHLAYILGRYQLERPLGHEGGEWFLSVNVGIPVAGFDDHRTYETFARITATAAAIASGASNLRLPEIREALRSATPELPSGFDLIPELAAAIAGYAAEATSRVGAHVLVDVGASTLDIVAFNLKDQSQASVFTAGVDLLGASALEFSRQAGIPDSDFKKACDALFGRVYGEAKSERRAPSLFRPGRRRFDVQLLTTGGGCHSALHAQFIGEMPTPGLLGELSVIRPLPPSTMTNLDCDSARLLLAYGLTRDVFEIVNLRRPSEIADLARAGSSTPAYLSPEQTYD